MFAAAARLATRRVSSRRMLSGNTPTTTGPRLPPGNDPSAYHPQEHAIADTARWMRFSLLFGLPVLGFGIIQGLQKHEHNDEPGIVYPYMKMATRNPRFPWGDDDLIGTPADRHEIQARKGEH
jgi:hypothetical protein